MTYNNNNNNIITVVERAKIKLIYLEQLRYYKQCYTNIQIKSACPISSLDCCMSFMPTPVFKNKGKVVGKFAS